MSFVELDAEKYMSEALSRKEEYDIVICDPPKLAPNAKSLPKAKRKCD